MNYDDEEEVEGRILNDSEYAEILKARADIFLVEKDSRLRNVELAALILAVGFIAFMSTRTIADIVASDFMDMISKEHGAKLVDGKQVAEMLERKKIEEEKKAREDIKTDKKKLAPQKSQGVNTRGGGGGDPRARMTAQGVLGIISGQIKGRSVASADIFSHGGFAKDIDAIISGVGGLAQGGDGGTGRRGAAGIGFGVGYSSGFGDGAGMGGIDDLIGNLMNGGANIELKKRTGNLDISKAAFETGGQLTGGRSRASIQRVVLQNMAALRHAYNRRLREKPGLTGKITVKFAIDEFGKVIFAQLVETSMSDPELEKTVIERVKSWVFEKIDKPGDVTEVVYPFVFSQ